MTTLKRRLRLTVPFGLAMLVAIGTVAAAAPLPESRDQESPAQITWNAGGIIAQGEVKTHELRLEDSTQTYLWMMYGSGNLNLALISPRGVVIDSTTYKSIPGAEWGEQPFPFGGMMEVLFLPKPESGAWTVRVTAQQVDDPSGVSGYMITTMIETPLVLSVEALPETPILGNQFRVIASLANASGPCVVASVTATVVDPGKGRDEFSLRDDGVGADSVAGDCVYSGLSKPVSLTGYHNVLVTATGVLPGDGGPFTRTAFTAGIVSRTLDPEERFSTLDMRGPSRTDPPMEVSVRHERDSKSGGHAYIYTVSNGSPFSLTSFVIGDHPSSRKGAITEPPIGWNEENGTDEGSYSAPPGWQLHYEAEPNSRGSLQWSSRDSSTALRPDVERSGWRVVVARPDSAYEHGNWSAAGVSRRWEFYRGTLVPTPRVASRLAPMERLGKLSIEPKRLRTRVALRFQTSESVAPEVSILDSAGELIRAFPEEESPGTDHRLEWDGRNMAGQRVPPGEYFIEVTYGNTQRYGRVTLLP